MKKRKEVITEARTWLGTPFHHQGRVKHVGCDCIGLIVGVVDACGLKAKDGSLLATHDINDYARLPDGFQLKSVLDEVLCPIDVADISPADVAMFAFEDDPQHVGLISEYSESLGIIHATSQTGKVVEHRLDRFWMGKMIGAYRFPDLIGE